MWSAQIFMQLLPQATGIYSEFIKKNIISGLFLSLQAELLSLIQQQENKDKEKEQGYNKNQFKFYL